MTQIPPRPAGDLARVALFIGDRLDEVYSALPARLLPLVPLALFDIALGALVHASEARQYEALPRREMPLETGSDKPIPGDFIKNTAGERLNAQS